jgi:hypothetical protein
LLHKRFHLFLFLLHKRFHLFRHNRLTTSTLLRRISFFLRAMNFTERKPVLCLYR